MKVTYQNPGFDYSIESILHFQTDDETPFWSDSLLYFYPQIDKNILAQKDALGKKQYITEVLSPIYKEICPELSEKAFAYNNHYSKYQNQINEAFSDAFDIDVSGIFNDLTGNICMNPVCPRFLREHSFDVFYKNSEKGALGMSLHEMVHYVWFHVWNMLFQDSYDEYERPSLKWILSEMVVESIMSDPRLSSINPYYPREGGGCIYPYFQNMIIDDRCILETLYGLYQKNDISNFMKQAYEYCTEHEAAIRKHIKQEEG